MGDGSFLEVSLEEDLVPINFAEVHPALGRGDSNQSSLEQQVNQSPLNSKQSTYVITQDDFG